MKLPVFRNILFLIAYAMIGCQPVRLVDQRLDSEMPKRIVWAWERPEDLRFLDPKEFGVAFLAQTVYLENNRVTPKRRLQPLEVAPGTYIIAVTRVETQKEMGKRPTFDGEMTSKVSSLIAATRELPDVKGVQVDFDAGSSERPFYRQMMFKLRELLDKEPDKSPRVPLTMTSLASWCTGDAWFNDFPVDEAVPMIFQMGADEEKIKTYLRNGNDWREPLCRGSYGLALDDPTVIGVKPGRRVYYFKKSGWSGSDITNLQR